MEPQLAQSNNLEDEVEAVCEINIVRRASTSRFSLDRNSSLPSIAVLQKSKFRTLIWGRGDYGQLGNGQADGLSTVTVNEHIGDRDLHYVAGNLFNSAIVTGDGEVFTMGSNTEGQLGIKVNNEMVSVPSRVTALENFRVSQIQCGLDFMVAVTESGKLASWGSNHSGQLGHVRKDGTFTISKPTILKSVDELNFVRVASGAQHSLALTGGGQVYSFGNGAFGALGHGNSNNIVQPLMIDGLWEVGVVQISCGENHCAALSADGRLFTWGHGKYGQLGQNSYENSNVPKEVVFPEKVEVVQICCGGNHMLALTKNSVDQQSVFSWGQGSSGQTGLGRTENVSSPQLISGLCGQDIAQISAGLRHSLVLTRDQKLFAFGNNESGQIGLCQDNPTIPNPTIVPGFDGLLILFAAAMGDHNMAVVQQISNDKTNSVDGQLISGPLPSGRLQGRACLPHELPLLLEIISEANSTGEFGYLNRVVEDVFSSPGLLLAGFQNIHNTQENKQDHNLDLNAINAIYAKLINPDNPKIIIHLGQACLRILYQIQALLDDEKVDMFMCMRLLLILIQNPFNMQQHILEEERLGPQLLLLYYGVIRQLQQDQRSFNTFCEWLREIPPEVFGRDLVKATQENIIHVVQNQSWRVARQGIRSMLNILRVFYDVSTMGGKDLIPFSRFHNEIVCKASSAQIEYQHWKQANEWSLLEYPFILTAEAKSQYVQYEAFIQQQFQFQQSQFQAFISGGGLLRMASIGFFTVSIRRSDVMRDALTKILNSNPHDFKKKLRVKFVSNGVEEEGQDEGGLTKEFFQLLTRDLFDVQYGMYSYDYETRTYWFNSMDLDAEQRLEFELVGILFGLAIYNGVLLDVHFPLVVYKKLLGQTPTFEDLKQAFPQLGKGLQQLLEFDGDVENTFMRDFTIQQSVFGEVITKELKPGGANIPVTSENRQEYVDLYTQFLLTDSIKPHFVAFSVGFKKVCDLSPQGVLSLLRAEELEQLVCGLPHLDFKALEQNTRYDGGYTYDHPAIKMFWEIVGQFTLSQKKKFLAFTTGSDRSPVGGLGTMRFIVQRGGPDTEKLPTSHTCFNILLLPQYSSKDKMRQKLLTAIENAEGFGLR